MAKVTVTYPQPITVKVNTGKSQTVHSTATFVGTANNYFPDTGGTIHGNLTIEGDTFTGNILPRATETYDIGSPILRYRTLYLAGNTIDLGGGSISANGNTVTFVSPEGAILYFSGNANTIIDAAAGERAEETANYAATLATGAYYYAGEAVTTSNYAANTGNAAFDTANSSYTLAEGAYYYSADAYATADEAANNANVAIETANTAANTANDALTLSTGAYYYAGEAYFTANNAFIEANNAYLEANNAYLSANLAYELANSLNLSSNAYIKRTGDTANGTIIFSSASLNVTDLNTAVGFVSSNTGIDLFASNSSYTQLNYSNTSTVKANSNGTFVSTQYNSLAIDDSNRIITIATENVFSLVVNNFTAIEVYANNDIFLNGTIYGAPTALDGGEF